MQAVGSILEAFDSDKQIPLLGFGAQLPGYTSVSHSFALNGDIFRPEVIGIQGALNCYINCIQKIQLSGPTYFAPIIRMIGNMASSLKSSYSILLLLTDGVILDLENTKEEIVRASLLPLSIIIVGVGNENFSAMEVLDGDNGRLTAKVMGEAKRDIVQFVAFKDYGNDAIKLASSTLKEVPRQFMDYVEFAKIPLTRSNEFVDYFSDKKAALMTHLGSNGVDM